MFLDPIYTGAPAAILVSTAAVFGLATAKAVMVGATTTAAKAAAAIESGANTVSGWLLVLPIP